MPKNKSISGNLSSSNLSFPTSGAIPIRMTSDLLFHYLLQDEKTNILEGIISSYLDIPINDIKSVNVRNPISYGDDITSKQMVLDIVAELNNDQIINLEMQVYNFHDWPERSLSYCCRFFDNLETGVPYSKVKSVYHIGFLDYTLFPEVAQFISTYTLREVKTNYEFTSKFRITVVDLKRVNEADETDKKAHRDLWAKFFKATTWEEIDMLAAKDEYINEAATKLHQLAEDKRFRDQYWEREDYIRREMDRDLYYENIIAGVIAEKDNTIAAKDAYIAELEAKLASIDK